MLATDCIRGSVNKSLILGAVAITLAVGLYLLYADVRRCDSAPEPEPIAAEESRSPLPDATSAAVASTTRAMPAQDEPMTELERTASEFARTHDLQISERVKERLEMMGEEPIDYFVHEYELDLLIADWQASGIQPLIFDVANLPIEEGRARLTKMLFPDAAPDAVPRSAELDACLEAYLGDVKRSYNAAYSDAVAKLQLRPEQKQNASYRTRIALIEAERAAIAEMVELVRRITPVYHARITEALRIANPGSRLEPQFSWVVPQDSAKQE